MTTSPLSFLHPPNSAAKARKEFERYGYYVQAVDNWDETPNDPTTDHDNKVYIKSVGTAGTTQRVVIALVTVEPGCQATCKDDKCKEVCITFDCKTKCKGIKDADDNATCVTKCKADDDECKAGKDGKDGGCPAANANILTWHEARN